MAVQMMDGRVVEQINKFYDDIRRFIGIKTLRWGKNLIRNNNKLSHTGALCERRGMIRSHLIIK